MVERNECWYKEVCTNTNCSNSCVRWIVMNSLCEQSGLSKKQTFTKKLISDKCDYDSFIYLDNYRKNIMQHVKNGDNLYIYSQNCGNGKTSWSVKLLMKYFDSIWNKAGFDCKGLFIYVPEFLLNCKEHFRRQDDTQFMNLVSLTKSVPLVVWDDITFINLTDFEREMFLSVLDTRMRKGLSNIYTGNLIPENINSNNTDNRLFSRILNTSVRVELKSMDRRLEING